MTHPDKWWHPKTTKKYKCPICGETTLEIWAFRNCRVGCLYEELDYTSVYHCPGDHSILDGGSIFTKGELENG